MQDIIAPELREMRARLDALDERLGRMESQFNQVQHETKRQHDETMFAVRSLIDYNNLNQRLSQLEKSLPPSSKQ
jgi:tetrahydromethanopterin S-methyltransferase subunit G